MKIEENAQRGKMKARGKVRRRKTLVGVTRKIDIVRSNERANSMGLSIGSRGSEVRE